MQNRLKTIYALQSLLDRATANPDHILWTKSWDYDPNFWVEFTYGGAPYALYLQGEDCGHIDYVLILCEGVSDADCPVGKQIIVHKFRHQDESKAKAWAEQWLLKAIKYAAEHNITLPEYIEINKKRRKK